MGKTQIAATRTTCFVPACRGSGRTVTTSNNLNLPSLGDSQSSVPNQHYILTSVIKTYVELQCYGTWIDGSHWRAFVHLATQLGVCFSYNTQLTLSSHRRKQVILRTKLNLLLGQPVASILRLHSTYRTLSDQSIQAWSISISFACAIHSLRFHDSMTETFLANLSPEARTIYALWDTSYSHAVYIISNEVAPNVPSRTWNSIILGWCLTFCSSLLIIKSIAWYLACYHAISLRIQPLWSHHLLHTLACHIHIEWYFAHSRLLEPL